MVWYWRYSVPYAGSLDDLLAVLRDRSPEKADAVSLERRQVEHGLLSVGLKVHYLGKGSDFSALVQRLGGAARALEINVYRHAQASLCLVLPPVGTARVAILLLECIERFTGCSLFGNRRIQIQVCSPGRLDARRSALLGIGFYLGSDTLRRYALGDFETTVSKDFHYNRGQRLVIYDAGGSFERGFEWWERSANGRGRLMIRPRLPFEYGRSDLLTGSGSRLDIENINLLATLLAHSQYEGYWSELGAQFEADMHALLDRHLLAGLVAAPWVRPESADRGGDRKFFDALQELVAYVFEESVRVSTKSARVASNAQAKAAGGGILQEMQLLLQKYRAELVTQSHLNGKGDRT
jgi:hypothetical protein